MEMIREELKNDVIKLIEKYEEELTYSQIGTVIEAVRAYVLEKELDG